MLAPFVDPVTKQRIRFVDSTKTSAAIMSELLDMSKMERCLGGHSNFEYRCAPRMHINYIDTIHKFICILMLVVIC